MEEKQEVPKRLREIKKIVSKRWNKNKDFPID